ncbi:MAG: DMT family transporter [Syntrophomonadaceae bacterium]|nr:DMT family transporter [Syntrophomonadaceae bacterium]MDD3023447.1 DMT family transporter [Syntrophomonadaceae bacterium]
MKQEYRGGIYLTLAASIWGGLYVVSKYALDTIPPFTLLFIRYLLAFVLLAIICWIKGIEIIPASDRKILFQIGFIGYFVSIAAQFVGTKLSTAHMGAVITTLSPIFLSIFAIILLREKLSRQQFIAMTLATIGVIVVMNPGEINMKGGTDLLGKLVLLLAAISWGYYSVLARKASATYSPLQITTCAILIAGLIDIPFIFMEAGSWSYGALLSPTIIGSIIYVGFISTALAFYCWNMGLALLPAHQAGPFFFFQPVVGTILSWLILKEDLTISFFIGGFCILLGVYLNMRE